MVSAARTQASRDYDHAGVAEAFAVVADAQRRSRHTVDDLLLQPHIGAWAMHCLRGLRSGDGPTPEDLGHLGAIAASAAMRADQAFEVTTYVRDGSVMFPTFGSAQLGATRGWCRVRSRPGANGVEIGVAGRRVTVPFRAPVRSETTWHCLRRLRSSAHGVALDVELDDLDPFRGCGHLPTTERLAATVVDDWQAKLDEAWSLLVEDHPASAEAIGSGITSVVPLRATDVAPELSATCHDAVGAVAMTPPRTSLSLALALVHEFQHTKLSALLNLVPLVDRAPGTMVYAPWRSDPRPLRGLLQGAYAYLGLTGFWEVHRRRLGSGVMVGGSAWPHFEFALGCEQVSRATDTIWRSGQLSPAGTRFVEGMRGRLTELGRQSIPSVPLSWARLACLDHATSWRLRNLLPDAEQVAQWADAWLAGRACRWSSRPTTVIDGSGPMPSDGRLGLLRKRLGFPESWRMDVEGDSPADVLLVAGSFAEAADTYRSQLTRSPDDLASWAGLAFARRRQPSEATMALTTCPESVYALHRAVRTSSGVAPEAEELATWISNGARERG
jgi:HEXXH motif-containing protein